MPGNAEFRNCVREELKDLLSRETWDRTYTDLELANKIGVSKSYVGRLRRELGIHDHWARSVLLRIKAREERVAKLDAIREMLDRQGVGE